jgi:hypothetical protein
MCFQEFICKPLDEYLLAGPDELPDSPHFLRGVRPWRRDDPQLAYGGFRPDRDARLQVVGIPPRWPFGLRWRFRTRA